MSKQTTQNNTLYSQISLKEIQSPVKQHQSKMSDKVNIQKINAAAVNMYG